MAMLAAGTRGSSDAPSPSAGSVRKLSKAVSFKDDGPGVSSLSHSLSQNTNLLVAGDDATGTRSRALSAALTQTGNDHVVPAAAPPSQDISLTPAASQEARDASPAATWSPAGLQTASLAASSMEYGQARTHSRRRGRTAGRTVQALWTAHNVHRDQDAAFLGGPHDDVSHRRMRSQPRRSTGCWLPGGTKRGTFHRLGAERAVAAVTRKTGFGSVEPRCDTALQLIGSPTHV